MNDEEQVKKILEAKDRLDAASIPLMNRRAMIINPKSGEPEAVKIPMYKQVQIHCKILASRFFTLDKAKVQPGEIFTDVTGTQYRLMKDGSIRRAVPKARRRNK